MNLFDLNSDVGWPIECEGEPSTPPCSVSPGIDVQEEIEIKNPPGVRSHIVKRSGKRQLCNIPAKAIAGAITKFGEMIVMLEREKIEAQRQQTERDERMFEIQAKMQYEHTFN